MRLSWNEIRVRAKAFAEEHKDAKYEKGETQSFYDAFFNVFGIKRKSVGRYEEAVKDLKGNSQFIDLLWPGVLIVEQKSEGRDLKKAESQAYRYFDLLKPDQQPRYVMVCDFQNFQLRDLAERETLEFPLKDLYKHVQKFGFMIGVERRTFKDQDPVNIKAAELVGKLHDALEDAGTTGRDLEVFLVQIVFCLFADDTGVFQPKDTFLNFLEGRTAEDGSDLGPKLAQLFQTLDTPEDKRSKHLDEDLSDFPYINGRLFERQTRIPSFNSDMRDKLIAASRFDWSPISPAIFGALFQSVMDKDERRKKGAHYTTEKNIMKVIEPLFLDELYAEFERAKNLKRGKAAALDSLLKKLGSLTFFDPACGCGNFLIIAYRELRTLEIEVLKAKLGKSAGQLELDANILSTIDVDQFYGIEIGEFPARIAETAMWMMDHIMNNELSLAFGQSYARIPLKKAASIKFDNALHVEWNSILPAEKCNYILGNPPFIGHSNRDHKQVEDMHRIWGVDKQVNRLDYVTCWFKKAIEYSSKYKIDISFVTTNSISQGEQVPIFWQYISETDYKPYFAHRTFNWSSEAKGKAAVHCVIIGLSKNQSLEKTIFDYDDYNGEPTARTVDRINGYLVDGQDLFIPPRARSNKSLPHITKGSQPTDGARLKINGEYITRSNLLMDEEDRNNILRDEPNLEPYLLPFIGSDELISGEYRWCLWLNDCPPSIIRSSKALKPRLDRVREGRLLSKTESVRKFAESPTVFTQIRQPKTEYIAIPRVSSLNRKYFPIAFLKPDIIASDALVTIPEGKLHHFSILMSYIHVAWTKTVAGRLKSDPRYSNAVYYGFPWPELDDKAKAVLTQTGQAILDARAEFPDATLADLYDPDTMPPALRKAHQANDKAVDRLYRKQPFESERERVEHLFMLYEQLQAPLVAAAKPKPKRRRAKTVKTS